MIPRKPYGQGTGGFTNQQTKHPWTPEDFARWGVRCIDAFSAEELVELQQKVEGWIRQRGSPLGSKRRRSPFVLKPRPVEHV
ncbi:MAG: hypothetical protein ACREOH_00680 [Candidatus Entotheonellia bacterium]